MTWKTLRNALIGTAAYLAIEPQLAQALSDARRMVLGDPMSDEVASVPIEPDEIPPRPATPQPAEPTLQPTTEPTTQSTTTDPVISFVDRLRSPLTSHGITPEISLVADYAKVLSGGVDTEGSSLTHLLTFTLTVDTEQLLKWKGGTLFTSFQQQNGHSAIDDAGVYHDPSSIVADGRTELAEIWYQQQLFEEKLRIKIGKMDVLGDFGAPLNGPEFINSLMAFPTTDTAMPTYPDGAFGIVAVATPCEWCYIGGGVYDGAGQEGINTGENGPRTAYGDPADFYLHGECGLLWDGGTTGKVGKLALGGWHHTGSFDRHNRGTQDGASGWYLMFDQTLIRENPQTADDTQGLGCFVIYDHAEEAVIEANHHLAGGLSWTGLIPSRDADVCGLGCSWTHFSDGAGFARNSETVIESFYRFQINDWLSVKPDLQYFVDPASGADNALVGSVRVEVSF